MSGTFGPHVLLGLGACFIALVVCLVLLLPRRTARRSYEAIERAAMPRELAEARLFASERYFPSRGDLPLGARVDQVYRHGDQLVCVEGKTRSFAAVNESDRIELSVQAYCLRSHGHRTSSYGYVRLVIPGRPPLYKPVQLLSDDQLGWLVRRYRDLHQGRAQPAPAGNPRRCIRCPQAPKCPHRAYLASNRPQILQRTP